MTARARQTHVVLAALMLLAIMSASTTARPRITVIYRDKAFDFNTLHTWAWHPDGVGDVKMALTANDDPAAVRTRVEPTIIRAVEDALAKKGLSALAAGQTPDMYVRYHVLMSTNTAAETAEIFGAATPDWALPPVASPTTNLRIIERGSLVLDISAATRTIVWRVVAQAELDRSRSDDERRKRIQEAIRDMIGKWPGRT